MGSDSRGSDSRGSDLRGRSRLVLPRPDLVDLKDLAPFLARCSNLVMSHCTEVTPGFESIGLLELRVELLTADSVMDDLCRRFPNLHTIHCKTLLGLAEIIKAAADPGQVLPVCPAGSEGLYMLRTNDVPTSFSGPPIASSFKTEFTPSITRPMGALTQPVGADNLSDGALLSVSCLEDVPGWEDLHDVVVYEDDGFRVKPLVQFDRWASTDRCQTVRALTVFCAACPGTLQPTYFKRMNRVLRINC